MPLIIGLILRLTQAAQHYRLNQVGIVAPIDGLQQLLIAGRFRLSLTRQTQSQLAEELTQVLQFFLTWPFVHTIKRWQFMLLKKTGSADISRQHALFDQLVGIIANDRDDLINLALFIKQNTGFNGFKINRTTLTARGSQSPVEFVQLHNVRHHRYHGMIGRQGSTSAFKAQLVK